MKRIVIVGATSGIGLEVARLCMRKGWRVGVAGRRVQALDTLRAEAGVNGAGSGSVMGSEDAGPGSDAGFASGQIVTARIDVTREDAPERLGKLIEALGGMDIYLHCAGIGFNNSALEAQLEMATVETNGAGFTRMLVAAFDYFRRQGHNETRTDVAMGGEQSAGGVFGGGHIAVISSIAGTKGMGGAPAYSATKRYQNTYLDALAQLAHMERLPIRFTDIRPGFVATPLLGDVPHYPMLMRADRVAARIVRAIERRQRRVVIDRRYAALVFFWRLIPQWLWERMTVRAK